MKAVFFDADGTLCNIRTGVPESAAAAVSQLMKNGHLAFLCTGRCRALVTPDLLALGLDGILAACGTYIEYRGKVLLNHEVSLAAARESVGILRRNGMVPVLEGAEYMYYDREEYTNSVDWFAGLITQLLGERQKPIAGNEYNLHINKISAKKLPSSDPERACRELAQYFEPIRHVGSFEGRTIELLPNGFSKGIGVEAVCRAFGVPIQDAVVFGDSNNDVSMFEHCGFGVAMGNAAPKIQEMADYVTAPMEEDGIARALIHLGLI